MGMLDGKAIVVTGAGRGLGAAYATDAAKHGASVIVNDIDAPEAQETVDRITELGGRALVHAGDITSWKTAADLMDHCVDEFGALDGLVNNAGVAGSDPIVPAEQDEEHLRAVVEVNLIGVVICGTHAIRHMQRQGHGSIVNVISGSVSGSTGLAVYGATKGAALSLTLSWAVDLGPAGIRVNAIAPMAKTRMWNLDLIPDGFIPPLDRVRPEDNAPVVTFLLSDAAAKLNGQLVAIRAGKLSLVTHPAVIDPVLEREHWTAEEVAEVFANQLESRVLPLGLTKVALTQLP